jgi:hypothetical protein
MVLYGLRRILPKKKLPNGSVEFVVSAIEGRGSRRKRDVMEKSLADKPTQKVICRAK